MLRAHSQRPGWGGRKAEGCFSTLQQPLLLLLGTARLYLKQFHAVFGRENDSPDGVTTFSTDLQEVTVEKMETLTVPRRLIGGAIRQNYYPNNSK